MRTDILLDESGDLKIEDGDFVIGPSDQQHVDDIVDFFNGEVKEFPTVGFGVLKYIKSNVSEIEFKRDLKIQLENDNYTNPTIDLSEGFTKLKIQI